MCFTSQVLESLLVFQESTVSTKGFSEEKNPPERSLASVRKLSLCLDIRLRANETRESMTKQALYQENELRR